MDARRPTSTEWPTFALAAVIYGGWLALTFCHAMLPWFVLLPAGAWVTAWHMSLQHETLHGHPTRWRRLNDALGSAPLSLWLPYARYRDLHLSHHRSVAITDPIEDPESHYMVPGRLARLPRALRWLLQWNTTLLGRITVGPLLGMAGFLAGEWDRAERGAEVRRAWLLHLAAVAPVLAWLVLACRMSPLTYIALFVLPGYALSLVRSYAEHRAATVEAHRTAIVDRAGPLGLLFLHNNLHVVHHARPGLPWYRIPSVWRRDRDAFVSENGGLIYRSYLEVARRFLLRPHDALEHPHPGSAA